MKKIISVMLVVLAVMCCLAACGNDKNNNNDDVNKIIEYKNASDVDTEGKYFDTTTTNAGVEIDMDMVKGQINSYKYESFARTDDVSEFAVIRIKDYGDVVIALRSDVAPKSVANFQGLVSSGFYKDTIFHRVIKDFMIQGGGIDVDGTSKESPSIMGEFQANGFSNNLLHEAGVLSMARTNEMNSASSQFFIMHKYSEWLDGQYAAFGYVLVGLDVVNSIATQSTNSSDRPLEDIVISDVFFVEPIVGVGLGSEKKYEPHAHTFGDWENVKPPSCAEFGEDKRACTECGITETRKIDKLQHSFENGTCTVCGKYNFEADADTESGIIDTSITGSGTDIDMEKVIEQIGAYKSTDFVRSDETTDFVAVRIKDHGDIVIALRSDVAPETVKAFKSLISDDFYRGIIFHRVIKDFVIQAGAYTQDGDMKSADNVKGEFSENGFENALSHVRGVISMARASDPDSASSQFFIMHEDAKSLDGMYAAFGYVLSGLDAVDSVAGVEVGGSSRPSDSVVIEEIIFVKPAEGVGLCG